MEVILMKAFWTIVKILAVLAAIAGIIYVIAAYGDKMVAWAKKIINRHKKPIFTYSTSYGEPVGEVEEVEEVGDADFAG
jgi:hypothetical protein